MPSDTEIVYSLKDLFALQLPTGGPTIYNIPLTANEWTEVISGLSNVAVWLLYNRSTHNTSRRIEYAYEQNPSNYRTLEADTILVQNTSLTQLFCRSTAADIIELEVWLYEKDSG